LEVGELIEEDEDYEEQDQDSDIMMMPPHMVVSLTALLT
jgi:hypothetical protein